MISLAARKTDKTCRNKKLLVTRCIATSSKKLLVVPGITAGNKKLLVTMCTEHCGAGAGARTATWSPVSPLHHPVHLITDLEMIGRNKRVFLQTPKKQNNFTR